MDFKKGCRYDVIYSHAQKVFNKPKLVSVEITLKNLMFYKSTECYYIFWTDKEFVRIAKKQFISAEKR